MNNTLELIMAQESHTVEIGQVKGSINSRTQTLQAKKCLCYSACNENLLAGLIDCTTSHMTNNTYLQLSSWFDFDNWIFPSILGLTDPYPELKDHSLARHN